MSDMTYAKGRYDRSPGGGGDDFPEVESGYQAAPNFPTGWEDKGVVEVSRNKNASESSD